MTYVYTMTGLSKNVTHHYQFAASDGRDAATGDTGENTGPTVANTPPPAPVVTIPAQAFTDQDISVQITQPPDVDGDTVQYTYAWFTTGPVSMIGYTSNPLPASATTKGDTWYCEVTVSDGEATLYRPQQRSPHPEQRAGGLCR